MAQQITSRAPHPSDQTAALSDLESSFTRNEHLCRHDHEHDSLRTRLKESHNMDHHFQDNISFSAGSKQAEQTVAPFLAEHIPMEYNHLGSAPHTLKSAIEAAAQPPEPPKTTKFCYRHRPDLKCRRQADEPSMEQLQRELASLSSSDQQAVSHMWSLFSAAPSKIRNIMLQGILAQCCFPQLSFISANVRDLIKIDFLSALPAELGFKILCSLDTSSLCKAAQVSQRWRTLADDDVVWHRMCEQHIDRKCTKCGWGLPLLERKRLRNEKRQIHLRATGKLPSDCSDEESVSPDNGVSDTSAAVPATSTPAPDDTAVTQSAGVKRPLEEEDVTPEGSKRVCTDSHRHDEPTVTSQKDAESQIEQRRRPWKDVYKDRYRVGTAWKYGRFKTKIFKGHTNGVMCLQFDDNILVSGSYDCTVKVWDVETGIERMTLRGHTSGIRCLQFEGRKLITGSLDKTIKIWDLGSGRCLRTFSNIHSAGIITLHFTKKWLASGSMDHSIRVMDFSESQPVSFTLKGHTDWVNCVQIDEASRTLFSASDDLTVRLWDLDTRECIKVFEGHVGQVQQVLPMPAEFELDTPYRPRVEEDFNDDAKSSSSVDSHPCLSDAPVPAQPFWLNDSDRAAPPRYMITGSLDNTIRIWDIHAPPASPEISDQLSHAIPTDPLTNSHIPRAQGCVRTLFGHLEGIWALASDHLRLISGSEDRTLKVWDPRTGKCEKSFTGHTGPVTCAWLSDSRVASGSEDCEVRILDFRPS
ncbi:WD40 repeat-like protein [Polychaeton citri CBS 116435]|uniref:WD40 repeat-like protein n=1 Tax=Polychaeton citri CBS 116435 TaxID=1314669 RepID=A0A9P4PXW5_9PEZI|nr:WD40 repeat-like protein [Polychaeton citri CBS 116435]